MTPTVRSLQEELNSLSASNFVLSSERTFLDLTWDADMTLEELLALDPAVVVDAIENRRRVVVQRIRGQLRYWLTEDRLHDGSAASSELGTLFSVEDVYVLCKEFLVDGVDAARLQTPRICGRKEA